MVHEIREFLFVLRDVFFFLVYVLPNTIPLIRHFITRLEVEYEGQLQENMFHGEGVLKYPMGQKIKGIWNRGYLESFTFVFPDGLQYYEPWDYCQMPDRRYYSAIPRTEKILHDIVLDFIQA